MMRFVAAVLLPLLAAGAAGAEEIPQTLLDADYTQCHAACSQAKEESQCAVYCACITDSVQSEFTLEEYTPMALALAADQQADAASLSKLGGIAETCKNNSFQ